MAKPRCRKCAAARRQVEALLRAWRLEDDVRVVAERLAKDFGQEPAAFASQMLRSKLAEIDSERRNPVDAT